jgi:hypothetical protein
MYICGEFWVPLVKQEMRGESSDCSDPMEDEDGKGGPRSARRHLSKNLVAERKRRKKLNERLYSLRALVPKITKVKKTGILTAILCPKRSVL